MTKTISLLAAVCAAATIAAETTDRVSDTPDQTGRVSETLGGNADAAATIAAETSGRALGASNTNGVEAVDLGSVTVVGSAISKYRPETVNGGTFTDVPPEKLPNVVDTITEDFIREKNPTDLNDLLRWVPGVETAGSSLLVRQPGTFAVRGGGGVEPALDGVFTLGRGSGLFVDPFLMERVEVVKGPIAALSGGASAVQNASGGTGSVNLYLKGAHLRENEVNFQENTTIGRRTFRQRGMADANWVVIEDKLAFRAIGTADYYEPPYIHEGLQKGARGRESYTVSPSFIASPSEGVKFGMKTLFQYTDAPSYIGVPVWRGEPGGGYSWRESSCRPGDRQRFRTMMLSPWLDWQVNDDWLLKFGASFIISQWSQTTLEPYTSNKNLDYYWQHGEWPGGEKYMTSDFSWSKALTRNYSAFARSVYESEFECGFKNSLMVQTDAALRQGGGFVDADTTRYGVTIQDMPSWGWVGLTGGVRYDYSRLASYRGSDDVRRKAQDCHSVSPRGGITIQPLDWLVFFGNISQTRTPMFACPDANGDPLKKPWYNTQYEGGLRIKLINRLWFSASYYLIDQENTPVEGGRNAGGYWYVQEGRTTSQGVDLSLSGDITDNWTLMAMYSYNKYTNRDVDEGEKGRDFERYPAHTLTVNTSYCVETGPLADIAFGGGFRFRSMSYATMRGTFVDESARFDPSYLIDLNVSVPFSKFGGSEDWIVTLGVRNLLDWEYFDSSRHYYECFVGEPRTFEIGIRGKF